MNDLTKECKLDVLMDVEGFDSFDELCVDSHDSVNCGICMNEGCDYTTTVEPDCSDGWCEECGTNTVKSATELILF